MRNENESKELCDEKYVPIGEKTKKGVERYFVLIVKANGDGEYERVGVGMVQSGYVLKERRSGRLVGMIFYKKSQRSDRRRYDVNFKF